MTLGNILQQLIDQSGHVYTPEKYKRLCFKSMLSELGPVNLISANNYIFKIDKDFNISRINYLDAKNTFDASALLIRSFHNTTKAVLICRFNNSFRPVMDIETKHGRPGIHVHDDILSRKRVLGIAVTGQWVNAVKETGIFELKDNSNGGYATLTPSVLALSFKALVAGGASNGVPNRLTDFTLDLLDSFSRNRNTVTHVMNMIVMGQIWPTVNPNGSITLAPKPNTPHRVETKIKLGKLIENVNREGRVLQEAIMVCNDLRMKHWEDQRIVNNINYIYGMLHSANSLRYMSYRIHRCTPSFIDNVFTVNILLCATPTDSDAKLNPIHVTMKYNLADDLV